jgi:DNA polymerase III subunit epsilon
VKADEGACGCFPTGKHYPGIAHLLKLTVRGVVEGISLDAPWEEIPIALLDVETTGREASQDRVVEVGIVIGQRGKIERRHNWMVNPERAIAPEAQAVHGISDEDVRNAPTFTKIADEFVQALDGCVLAAYNASFDKGFILAELGRAGKSVERIANLKVGIEWIDPLIWARELYADEKSRTLGDMAARLGIKLENAHRASDDAEAALQVLYRLGKDPRVPKTYGAFIQEQRRLGMIQADARRLWRRS